MIHVLHLISSFGLGGGSEPNLLRVVRRMDKLRFRNTIVTMTEGVGYEGLRSELERDNIRVYSLAMRRGVANPLRAARLLKDRQKHPAEYPTNVDVSCRFARHFGWAAGTGPHNCLEYSVLITQCF